MMDKKTILEKGLLQQYVLGDLNPKEAEQLENVLNSDIELRTIFNRLEQDFERLGLENAIAPPPQVKDKLLTTVKSLSDEPKVIAINNKPKANWYLGIAASVAGLFLLTSIWMFSELNSTKEELQIVKNSNSELSDQLNILSQKLNKDTALYAAVIHPDTEQYILKGNDLLPEAKVVSYVNHNTKSVLINTERLPDLDEQQDYQMWADVEGEMIDMGVISKTEDLLAMTYIEDAESLNITIEPAGGNDHPTVANLITNVYLN